MLEHRTKGLAARSSSAAKIPHDSDWLAARAKRMRSVEVMKLAGAMPTMPMAPMMPNGVPAVDDLIFEGWASRPPEDYAGDVVEGLGCELPPGRASVPLLADHDPKNIIGRAWLYPQPDGVRMVGQFSPPGVSRLADQRRAEVRAGILTDLSIGFQILEATPLPARGKGKGGLHITRARILEVSIVSIAANPAAIITGKNWTAGKILAACVTPPVTGAAPQEIEVTRPVLGDFPSWLHYQAALRKFEFGRTARVSARTFRSDLTDKVARAQRMEMVAALAPRNERTGA